MKSGTEHNAVLDGPFGFDPADIEETLRGALADIAAQLRLDGVRH